MAREFEGKHVVVTGGTGALGAAAVARLLDEGAICHVPVNQAAAPSGFALSGHERVRIAPNVDLTDAKAVDAFYAAIPGLWASVHAAGGFAMAPIEKTEPGDFTAMMNINATTVFLCSRAAATAMLASKAAGVSSTSRRALHSTRARVPAWSPTRRARRRWPR